MKAIRSSEKSTALYSTTPSQPRRPASSATSPRDPLTSRAATLHVS
jgi:hypothetical protein